MKSGSWMLTNTLCSVVMLACCGLADAQSLPRLKPISPAWAADQRCGAYGEPSDGVPLASAEQPTSFYYQRLQRRVPPGAANPLLLTDGSVIVQDAGCHPTGGA